MFAQVLGLCPIQDRMLVYFLMCISLCHSILKFITKPENTDYKYQKIRAILMAPQALSSYLSLGSKFWKLSSEQAGCHNINITQHNTTLHNITCGWLFSKRHKVPAISLHTGLPGQTAALITVIQLHIQPRNHDPHRKYPAVFPASL